MNHLLEEIRNCTICAEHLPLGPRPVIEASENSRIIIVGQAPGTKVHESGVPWDDQSGRKLREWLGVSNELFYDIENFGIVPMGFCYPGKGKTGDLPPRKECAENWHDKVFKAFRKVELILLVGTYAQNYFLRNDERNLTEKVRNYSEFLPEFWPLPHPSPVNRFWRSKNTWFEKEVVPELQKKIHQTLKY